MSCHRLPLPALLFVAAALCQSQGGTAPAFEVASIHQIVNPHVEDTITISGTLVRMQGYAVQNLITEAYHLRDYEVSMQALPDRDQIADTFFDIEARAPGDSEPTRDQVREMIKSLLAERFKLVFHREPKEMPVFALVADQHPKLKPSDPSEEHSAHIGPSGNGHNYRYTFRACTMEEIVSTLAPTVDRPLVDKTGLTGKYDMEFEAVPGSRMPQPEDTVVSTALREFGLKLVKDKAAVSVLVVDRVEKPSDN